MLNAHDPCNDVLSFHGQRIALGDFYPDFSDILLVLFGGAGTSTFWAVIKSRKEESFSIYGEIELTVTRKNISWKHKVLGEDQIFNAQLQDISMIEMIHNQYLLNHINIWAGVKQFEFSENLTKPELEWLAKECSMWLNLSITRNNNTLD